MRRFLERLLKLIEAIRSSLHVMLGKHETSEEIIRRYIDEEPAGARDAPLEFDSRAEAQRRFLEEMERQHQEERSRLRRDEALLQAQERTTYTLFVILALVCIGFVAFGGYLILRGSVVSGALSEVLGLASGAGAGLLKFMAGRSDERRKQIAKESREMVEVLQATQAALAAGGEQMVEVASWLRERATRSSDS